MKDDILEDLKFFIPSIHERKTDDFLNFLQLMEDTKFLDGESVKAAIMDFGDKIDKEDYDDFKYLLIEFIKSLSFLDKIIQGVKVPIFMHLLSKNLIDEDRFDNPVYLRFAVQKNLSPEFFENMKMMTLIDRDFIEIAEHSFSVEKPLVGIALFAIAIEHKINEFYRDILIHKGLNDDEITQAIRTTNMKVKLGWFLSISCDIEMDHDLKVRLMRLFDFRNSIVHYKVIPEFDGDSIFEHNFIDRINEFNIDMLKEIVSRLERYFDDVCKQVIPNYEKATELAERALYAHPGLEGIISDV